MNFEVPALEFMDPGQSAPQGQSDAAGVTWSVAETNAVQVKNHITLVIPGNRVLMFGGYNAANMNRLLVQRAEGPPEWEEIQTRGGPCALNGHCAVLVGSAVVIIGGWDGEQVSSGVYALDTETWTWETWPVQLAANMCSAIFAQGQIYVFRGGDGSAYYNDVFTIHPETHELQTAEVHGTVPPPRANHASVLIGDDMYIISGWNGTERLRDAHRFHIPTHTWHTQKPPPIATTGATASHYRMANVRDYIVLCGEGNDDIHMYDVVRDEWTSHTPARGVDYVPSPRSFLPAYKNRNGHCALTFDPQHPRLIISGGVIREEDGTFTYPTETVVLDYGNVAPIVRVDAPRPRVAGFEAFFDDETFSDVCMRIQSETAPERLVHLHRVVLATANERFRAMFSHAWGDSEGTLNINLESRVSTDTFCTMLRYLYTGQVREDTTDNPVNWLDMLVLADEYLDDYLKQLCEVHLKEYADNGFPGTVLQYAQRYRADQLLVYCQYRQFYAS